MDNLSINQIMSEILARTMPEHYKEQHQALSILRDRFNKMDYAYSNGWTYDEYQMGKDHIKIKDSQGGEE